MLFIKDGGKGQEPNITCDVRGRLNSEAVAFYGIIME